MSYTYQKTNIETLMPEGDYEARIENAELKTLPRYDIYILLIIFIKSLNYMNN